MAKVITIMYGLEMENKEDNNYNGCDQAGIIESP